jgi:hypothetical protein
VPKLIDVPVPADPAGGPKRDRSRDHAAEDGALAETRR